MLAFAHKVSGSVAIETLPKWLPWGLGNVSEGRASSSITTRSSYVHWDSHVIEGAGGVGRVIVRGPPLVLSLILAPLPLHVVLILKLWGNPRSSIVRKVSHGSSLIWRGSSPSTGEHN